MTNAEARFNNSLRPRKPEGSLGRTAQDGHLDSHTAPELCFFLEFEFEFFPHFSPTGDRRCELNSSSSFPSISLWGFYSVTCIHPPQYSFYHSDTQSKLRRKKHARIINFVFASNKTRLTTTTITMTSVKTAKRTTYQQHR